MAPAFLRRVNTRTSTPLNATVLAWFAILVLATSFTLTGLAQATSFIILAVFTLVNLALANLRWSSREDTTLYTVPWLPLLAATSCASMLLVRLAMELTELQST